MVRGQAARPLTAALCLLLLGLAAVAFSSGKAASSGQRSEAPRHRRRLAADVVLGPDGTPLGQLSFCNETSATALKPIPCTQDQNEDLMEDLLEDMLPADHPGAIIDTSVCDPADSEGYTEAVDLMDIDVVNVAVAVAEVFASTAGNESFWQQECQGDIIPDAYNACRQPAVADGGPVRPGRRWAGMHVAVASAGACCVRTAWNQRAHPLPAPLEFQLQACTSPTHIAHATFYSMP